MNKVKLASCLVLVPVPFVANGLAQSDKARKIDELMNAVCRRPTVFRSRTGDGRWKGDLREGFWSCKCRLQDSKSTEHAHRHRIDYETDDQRCLKPSHRGE